MSLSPRFTEALAFAARLHRDQVRKGPDHVPYVSHLLTVAGTVIEYGGTEDEAIAALLHDAIEDQGGAATREIIVRLFGEPVARIVDGCTDASTVPKPPWHLRKQTYVERLREAPPSVLVVVLADKLSNVRSTLRDLRVTGPEIWNRFRGGREGSLWYYRSVLDSARSADPRVTQLRDELERSFRELESLA
jgi:GTP pyrophosphokinase